MFFNEKLRFSKFKMAATRHFSKILTKIAATRHFSKNIDQNGRCSLRCRLKNNFKDASKCLKGHYWQALSIGMPQYIIHCHKTVQNKQKVYFDIFCDIFYYISIKILCVENSQLCTAYTFHNHFFGLKQIILDVYLNVQYTFYSQIAQFIWGGGGSILVPPCI